MEQEVCHRGVDELAQLIRQQKISAQDVTAAYLRRIKNIDEKLGAFLLVDEEGALASARKIDEKIAVGQSAGPLAGVPLALKDIFVTRNVRTTCGSRVLQNWLPPYDCAQVERLREAGAVILGKTNMDEFAMGSSNENSAFFPTRNPWDLARVPGGSSGGSAAAVAADLCAGSLGTDTGGSIRQPAAFCGVVGIKPTYGRVSRFGVIAFASSLDQVGPFAKNVGDAALLLEVLAGHDPRDATSLMAPVGNYLRACERGRTGQGLKDLRLGVPREYFVSGMEREIEIAVRHAIETMRSAGAKIVEVSLPHTKYAVAVYYLICTAEASANLARYDGVRYGFCSDDKSGLEQMYVRTRQEGLGEEVKRRIMLGTYALSAGYYDAYYAKAQKVRTLIRRDFDEAFKQCDLLVTPVSPAGPFVLGEKNVSPLQRYLADIFTISCNLAGLPGLSLPAGFTEAGLPIGLQIIGPPLGEEQVFTAAAGYEALTTWHQQKPRLKGAA